MDKQTTIEKAMSKLEAKLKKPVMEAPAPSESSAPPPPVPEMAKTAPQASVRAESATGVERDRVVFKAAPERSSADHERIAHNIILEDLEARGLVSPTRPRSVIAEEYRNIKRPLIKNIENQSSGRIANANMIMVTSAISGEGKTFSAVNLAISMAMEQDRTVLLVDADVTKASAARLLGISDENPGLIDVLEGNVDRFSDVLVHTNIPKLRVLPAGRLHEHATELLAGENMKSLMKEISDRYPDRVVIFDSPPLLMTSEAAVLASHMGQIVFVVAAEQSSPQAVEDAIEQLGKDKMIGVVLNKARANPFMNQLYGYGYGYGYGEGSRRKNPSKSEAATTEG